MKYCFFLLLFSFPLSFVSCGQILPSPINKALDLVDTNKIRSHITYLADDKLRVRLPGTEYYYNEEQ
jgi:hypothetical protein